MKKYDIIRELGSGSYGKVFLGRSKRNNQQYAIKEIQIGSLSQKEKDKAMQEVNLLKSLNHPHIVQLKDSFQEKGILYIVMEYVDGGDLAKKIRSQGTNLFSEEEILDIFIQIVLALQYLHEKKIIHRDLKPQNIFLTHTNIAKLGDFGVARALEGTQDLCQTVIGTPYYLSPEVWNNEPYNGQTDIWSLGCILYEMCSLKRPFTARDANQLFAKVMRGIYEPIPAKLSKDMKNLVTNMLNPVPSNRLTAEQILNLPFIQNVTKKKIQENENKLKKLNIIVPDQRRPAKPKGNQNLIKKSPIISPKPPSSAKAKKSTPQLPKLHSQPDFSQMMELPLPPDEEAPRWATHRGAQFAKPDEITVNSSPDELKDISDLQESTQELHKSLTLSIPQDNLPLWAKPSEPVKMGSADEIPALRNELMSILNEQLFDMLHQYILEENEVESSAQFVSIMEEEDLDSVEKMRKLVHLENIAK